MTRLLLASCCAVALTGCDAATQIAGDAVEGEVRTAVVERCQQFADNAGIVADRINAVCECSADRFRADEDLTLADVNRENIEGIVNSCATEKGTDTNDATNTTPTETIGG